jgi:WS/DGAT/MGAT family acyltransferase
MDRLSSIDAGFLAQERSGAHMHIGNVMLFDGAAPSREEFCEHISTRLHLVPRYRQKLAWPRLELGRPLWIDDPRFNIDYHVRVTALPEPGTLEQLRLLAGRVFSQRLDRSKPLWEVWLVHGLEGDRFALINKAHHCLVDGVSGVDITTVLFDLEPEPARLDGDPDPWVPAPEPSDVAIAAEGIAGLVRTPLSLAGHALSAITKPGRTLSQVRDAAEAVGEVAWGLVSGAPDTPLNQPCGSHRHLYWIHADLADLKAVKDALGGTVNDVFLNVVSGALRRWLHTRGVRTEGLELRGAVPVSLRAEDEHGQLGNRITIMVGSLPVYACDPVERQRIVSASMADLKESKQALGAELIAGLQEFAPPTVFAQASRLNFSPRMYNLLVTNVPGPQFPLYLLGRELGELVPVAFLAAEQILAVAIMSYNGGVDIGLIGDYDTMPDLEELGAMFEESIAELREAAALSAEASPRA